MNKFEITIIIPIYNTPIECLKRCIDSVINQTCRNIQIILVNDGSDDIKVINLINEYNNLDNILLLNKDNGGVSSARNYGLKYATGLYIAFLDSDDYVDSQYYENLYKYTNNNDDVILGIRVIGRKNKYSHKKPYGSKCVTGLFKREFLETYKLKFDETLNKGEDTDFRHKYMKKTSNIIETEDCRIYYHYMIRENSLSKYDKNIVDAINN